MSNVEYTKCITINKVNLAQFIGEQDLFGDLPLDQVEYIASVAKIVDFKNGAIVLSKHDRSHDFYMLLRGHLKLAMTSFQGIEKVVCLLESGQIFGEDRLFLEDSDHFLDAYAISDCQILVIPRDIFFTLLDIPALSRRMLTMLSEQNHQLVKNMKYISLQNSTQRLISFLLQKHKDSTNAFCIRLSASKLTIASMLSITPETLSRSMLRLTKAGLIEVHGRDVLINDVAGLKGFV